MPGHVCGTLNCFWTGILILASSIETIDSRSALKCSRESFQYMLSFLQVPSSFLDFSFSFCFTSEPIDYHLTGFQGDKTLDLVQNRSLRIPRLGRSGLQHQMQYLLRSVERSSSHDGSTTWNIRQMAVYHSFDLVNGRSLWINMKTNSLMRERIQEAAAEFPQLSSTALHGLPGCFAATLLTQLVYLEWCDESWRPCINDIEKKIRDTLNKAKTARVDQRLEFSALATAKKTLTLQKSGNTTMDFHEKQLKRQGGSNLWQRLATACRKVRGNSNRRSSTPRPRGVRHDACTDNSEFSRQLDSLQALENFSLSEMQSLHYLGEKLESFRLVMELNRQTLRDIREHYQDLVENDGFSKDIKDGCKQELADFMRQLERVRKSLEVRSTQVKSLIAWLQDGKSLVRRLTGIWDALEC